MPIFFILLLTYAQGGREDVTVEIYPCFSPFTKRKFYNYLSLPSLKECCNVVRLFFPTEKYLLALFFPTEKYLLAFEIMKFLSSMPIVQKDWII